MNKKLMITFAFSFILIAGFATAGLVNYLSNTQEIDVDVLSPLTLTVTDLESVFAGESASIDITIENNINEEVYGNYVLTITNELGNAICDDYDSITVDILHGSDIGDGQDVLDQTDISGVCTDDGVITTLTVPVMYLPIESQSYVLHMEYAQNVKPTTYTTESVVNVVDGVYTPTQ